ncbi:MAG: hypothetical protein HQ588_05880 [Deltaproteobacteria bacterium]|nr:hypothetical protein [Deltaproteobacteria bacterium]
MVKSSRLITTTLLGLVFGIICMFLSRYAFEAAFWPLGASFLIHHTVMGFAIGASALKMNWAAHGVLWGALFGVFLAIGIVGTYNPWGIFVAIVIWGFLIELLTTKAYKRPQ